MKTIIFIGVLLVIGIISAVYWTNTPSSTDHFDYPKQFYDPGITNMALEGFRSKNNQRFPQSVSEFSKFHNNAFDSILIGLEMPDYMKSRTWFQLRPEIIIFYEKEVQPEKRYFQLASIGDKGEWITRPRGRYVFYAGGKGEHLKEEVFQEKLKYFQTEYAEQPFPFSYEIELNQGNDEESNTIFSLLQDQNYEELKAVLDSINFPEISRANKDSSKEEEQMKAILEKFDIKSSLGSEPNIVHLSKENSITIEDSSELNKLFVEWGIPEKEYKKYKFAVPIAKSSKTTFAGLINSDPNTCLILSEAHSPYGNIISQGPIIDLEGYRSTSSKWVRLVDCSGSISRSYARIFFLTADNWKELFSDEHTNDLRGTIKFVEDSFDFESWLVKQLLDQGVIDEPDISILRRRAEGYQNE